MKTDYLSFRRATNVSLIGLIIQVVLALALGLYGYFRGSTDGIEHGAITAAIFGGTGVLVWLTLAILFDQSRRERIEAMEAEALGENASSVFAGSEDELRVNARRLAGMQKFMLPAVSAVIALILILVGIARLGPATNLFEDSALNPPTGSTAGLFIGLMVGFIGFILARYTSGMAKEKAWAPLRGGGAFAVGMSLFGVYLAVAHFVRIAGPDIVLRLEPIVFAAGLIVVGGEIALNLLVDIYRPRKAGDAIRPAFDSRLMAFVAAPDRVAESITEAIDYQFGFNVTDTWFFKIVSEQIAKLVLAGFAVVWLLTTVVIIEPDQRALVLRGGDVVRSDLGPGLHWKLPFPFEEVVVPEWVDERRGVRVQSTAAVRTLNLGTPPPRAGNDPILWTVEHAEAERFVIVRTTREESGNRDLALLAVEVPMKYSVSDVEKYERLGAPETRDDILRLTGQREVMLLLSKYTIDEILGPSRVEIAEILRGRVAAAYERLNPDDDGNPMGAGIDVLFVGFEGIHPPKDTAEAFERVVNAEQNRLGRVELAQQRAIEDLTRVVGSVELADRIAAEIDAWDQLKADGADREAVLEKEQQIESLLAEAGGTAATMIQAASAGRWQRHMDARSAATLYGGQIASYLANPELYTTDQRLDALAEAMRDARVFLTDDSVDLNMRIELQDNQSVVDVFDATDE